MPLGSDREARSDFQLIAGTNQHLLAAVRKGRFREDLLARINLWPFTLPGLQQRPEDIEPNLNCELEQLEARTNQHVTFSKEARDRFLRLVLSVEAKWSRNFRDLNAAIVRMGTFAQGSRISAGIVEEEVERLRSAWEMVESHDDEVLRPVLQAEQIEQLDLFDRVQLAKVVKVCRESRTISDAGRRLFGASREKKRA